MPDQTIDIVVAGGGLAAAKTVEALREKGFDGSIAIVGREEELPYERPPLSKGYLAGQAEFKDAIVHSAAWYDEHDITLMLGRTVTKADVDAHELTLDDESTLGFGKLVVATGAAPRYLNVPGAVAEHVLYLRTRKDADAIRSRFGRGRRMVVIGGGWIGLEVAAAARQADTEVTLVEAAPQPLLGVLGEDMGKVFARLHREHDVDLRLGLGVTDLTSEAGAVSGVTLSDTSHVEAATVVIGVGVVPNLDPFLESGLTLDNGIAVDASLRSSSPDVYAVGDVARHDHPVFGPLRVEHWANALNQPAVVAANLVGEQAVYDRLPYFFSDQYDLGMEYLGYAPPGSYERVVTRGNVDERKFTAFWVDGEQRVRAVMSVNVWDVVEQLRGVLTEQRPIEDLDRLADPGVDYSVF